MPLFKGRSPTFAHISIDEALQFIEDGLIYRLPWGLEAIRVRARANEDIIADGTTIDDYEVGLVVPAIENGTLNRSAALLMQSGFTSRKAALNAVSSTNAIFTNGYQFREWLNSDTTAGLATQSDWPTPETSELWQKYAEEYQPASNSIWGVVSEYIPVVWLPEYSPMSGSFVKILNYETGITQVIGSDGDKIGLLNLRYDLLKTGIYYAIIAENTDYLDVKFYGVGNEPFQDSNS